MSTVDTQQFSALRIAAVGYVGLVVFFGGFITWAISSQIAGAVVVAGKIEVDRDRQIVQHETGGVVTEILIDDGDAVSAGDLLIRLDPGKLKSQLIIVEGQLYELIARRGRLQAERDKSESIIFEEELINAGRESADLQELIDGQQNLFQARRDTIFQRTDQLGKRRKQIASQIAGINAQDRALERQLKLIGEELSKQHSLLERGLAQATTVLRLQREKARLHGQIGQLAASKAEAEERSTEISIEVLRLETTAREEAITDLRDLRYYELELVEKRIALKAAISQLNIRAPVSGIVHELMVKTPRSVIRSAEPLMHLVPQDRPLVIAMRIAPTDIDQIFLGQEVKLRLSAVDHRVTPELNGKVLKISADALEDPMTGKTYFRSEISLNPGQMQELPIGTTLLPGMPVEAFIQTGYRTPIEYLLKPMADYFARAFREN